MNCFRGPETMLPWLKQIRAAVVVATSVHCRSPTAPPPRNRRSSTLSARPRQRVPSLARSATFPEPRLDPLYAIRYEIGRVRQGDPRLGINYLGVCCGASPMLVREVAEAVGKSTEASRFSENMRNHFMYAPTSGYPSNMRRARRPGLAAKTPDPATPTVQPCPAQVGSAGGGTASSIASLPDVRRMRRDCRQPAAWLRAHRLGAGQPTEPVTCRLHAIATPSGFPKRWENSRYGCVASL